MAVRLRVSRWIRWKRKFDEVWNGKRAALGLGAIGAGISIWANLHLPLPGISVAILGAMAAIMSLRPKMELMEKAAWMVLIAAMLGAEIHSIRSDRATNESQQKGIRDQESAQFNEIAGGLKTAIAESENQFQATMTKEGAILDTTKSVGELTKENLANITGGDSFAHVTPQVGYTPMPLSIYNDGANTLAGVTVNVRKGLIEEGNPDLLGPFGQDIQIGTLASHELRIIPSVSIYPHVGKSGLDIYVFRIAAQNSSVEEWLYFKKPSIDNGPWAYKTTVTRRYVSSQKGKTTFYGYKKLMDSQWSDGSKDAPVPK